MSEEPAGRRSGEQHPDLSPAVATFRRLLAEGLGTFLLTSVAIGISALTPVLGTAVPDGVKAVAPAIVVALVIYSLGDVSGAHINPAVTVAFAMRSAFPWSRVPGYLIAQIGGALVSATLFRLGSPAALEAGVNRPHIETRPALVVEAALTTLLIVVILNVSTRESLLGAGAAIPVGLAITVDGLVGVALTGASMNPARSLGPALVSGQLTDVWLYIVGPTVGALISVVLTRALRGRYTAAEQEAARGKD